MHGIGGEWRAWEPVLDPLVAAGREVVAVDMPGFGGSPRLPHGEPCGPAALAAAVADFVRARVSDEPVDLVGHSLGGWVVLEMAKLGAARTVTAVAPAGFWTPRESRFARGALTAAHWAARRALPVLSRAYGTPLKGPLLRQQFTHPERVPPEAARRLSEALARSTGWGDVLDAMHRDRFRDGHAVAAPTTFVWGTDDRLILSRQAPRGPRAVPGARLAMVPETGHFPHWEDPDAVVAAVLERAGGGAG
ncbi:MAG TPA: alpha/beta fold hydrolase [Thermoleophilaceae bacterium]